MSGDRPDVQAYYEANTRRFLLLGQGGRAGAVHRAVWVEDAATRDEALHAVENLVLEQVKTTDARRVLDLGCGVGGSLLFLAPRAPQALFGGLTVSATQASRAASLLERAGLDERCRVVEGNYLDDAPYEQLGSWWAERSGSAELDLAFAIESFVHAVDPARLLAQVAGRLRPGGRLLLCDDFALASPRTPVERRRLDEFRCGWRAPSLLRRTEVERLASAAGMRLLECRDLTPHLELGRPRDRLVRVLAAAGRVVGPRSPFWGSLIGGDALQRCLASGLVRYLFMVLAR